MGIRRREGVSFEPSGDRVVILDDSATEMTTLNPVGSLIWMALDGERGVDALAKDLVAEFDGVDEATLRADIEDFVSNLAEIGLVDVD